jgi:hypothetical protein
VLDLQGRWHSFQRQQKTPIAVCVKRVNGGSVNNSKVNIMAGRGMGIATQGGGAVSSGAKNKVESNPAAKSTGIPMLAKGGAVNQHKRMAMGETAMAKGGMAKKMRKGGCA